LKTKSATCPHGMAIEFRARVRYSFLDCQPSYFQSRAVIKEAGHRAPGDYHAHNPGPAPQTDCKLEAGDGAVMPMELPNDRICCFPTKIKGLEARHRRKRFRQGDVEKHEM
jgi:hypothetical protein